MACCRRDEHRRAVLAMLTVGLTGMPRVAASQATPRMARVGVLLYGNTPADPLAYLQPIIITKDGGSGQQTSADARAHLKTVLGQ